MPISLGAESTNARSYCPSLHSKSPHIILGLPRAEKCTDYPTKMSALDAFLNEPLPLPNRTSPVVDATQSITSLFDDLLKFLRESYLPFFVESYAIPLCDSSVHPQIPHIFIRSM